MAFELTVALMNDAERTPFLLAKVSKGAVGCYADRLKIEALAREGRPSDVPVVVMEGERDESPRYYGPPQFVKCVEAEAHFGSLIWGAARTIDG